MQNARTAPVSRASDPAAWIAALLVGIATVTPTAWLIGSAEGVLEEQLRTGAWAWRVSLTALAAFLFVTVRLGVGREAAVRRPVDRAASAWLAGLLVLAAILRVVNLNTPLWHDELAMLVNLIQQPFGSLVRSFPSDNNHPLYTLLAWGAAAAFGEHPWTVRLPAVLFGVGSIWALFRLAAHVTGRREALFACGLLTVSYHHVWFSQNARGYTGLLFFTLVSSYWFIRAIEDGSKTSWRRHGVALALATYVHLAALYVAAAQFVIYLAVWLNPRSSVRRHPAHGLAAGAGFALAALVSLALHALILPQLVHFFFLREGRTAIDAAWTNPLWTALEAARSLGIGLPAGVAAVVLAAIVGGVGLVSYWRRAPLVVGLAVLPGVVGASVMLGMGRNLWPRFFFFLAGFAVLLGVRAIVAIGEEAARLVQPAHRAQAARWMSVTPLVAALALSVAMLPRNYRLPKQDYVGALEYVRSLRRQGEPVLTTGLAKFAYGEYYHADVQPIDTVDDLNRALQSRDGYVVYTFPIHLSSRYPALWQTLRERGREVGRFRGTVGDGDIVVLKVAP